MKNLRNSVQLIGRLGTDPEFHEFDNGKCLSRISLATSETYKNNNGEKVTDTQWHKLVAWNGTASFVKNYISKGDEVIVEGKLVHRSYETKEGEKKFITEIVVNELLPLRTATKNAESKAATVAKG
jgi:single-strand DNA-binding protein